MTRLEIGIPVVRALSTKLCHYKPRFDRTRLLAPDALDLCPAAAKPGPPWLTI
jgi:ribosomal protein S12 methylthiotransferase accessory factor